MVVEWLGKGFALDILAVFPLYGHFDYLFCCILYRQVNKCPSANRNLFVDGLKTSSCEWIALLLLNWFCMNVIVIILGVCIVAIENKCNSCISSCPICNNMRFFRKSLE